MVEPSIARETPLFQPHTGWRWLVLLLALYIVVTTAKIFQSHKAVHAAREAVFREDCRVIRQAIDGYTVDLHKAPESLGDVIQAGYLKTRPKDFSLEACR